MGSTSKTRAPRDIIGLLEEGLQATRMKTAVMSLSPDGMGSDADSDTIREATRIYRQTWVESPLAVVLAYLKGEISALQAERLWGAPSRAIDEDIRNPKILLGLEKPAVDAEPEPEVWCREHGKGCEYGCIR